MASEGGGKIRGKKNIEGSKPYARRQSLMGRVTDSVKDMLAPSWLVDLVSSVKKTTPPSSPAQLSNDNDQVPASSNHMPTLPRPDIRPSQPIMSGTSAQPAVAHQLHFQQHPQTPMQKVPQTAHLPSGDDNTEASGFSSASGCAMMPQREILHLNENKIAQLRKDLAGSVTPSRELEAQALAETRRMEQAPVEDTSFLWTTEVKQKSQTKPQPAAKSTKPTFNVSIFGSPIISPEKSTLLPSQSFQESSYYPGKTTFGGAAAHRRSRGWRNASYQVPSPARKQVTAKPLNSGSSRPGVTSSTAKKILDTLERMSTPLNDAKKMPSYSSSHIDSPLTFTPTSYHRRSTPARALGSNLDGPPVRGLQTPTQARIGKNLARPPIHQSDPNPSSVSVNPPSESLAIGGGGRPGKMKRDRGGGHYSRAHEPDGDPLEVPDFPTAFTLPATAMSGMKFSLDTSASSPCTTTLVSPVRGETMAVEASSPGVSAGFTFSSPIATTDYGQTAESGSLSPPAKFKFSSPLRVDGETTPSFTSSGSSTPATFGFAFSKPAAGLKMKTHGQASPLSGSQPFSPANEYKQGGLINAVGKAVVSPVATASSSNLKQGSVLEALGVNPKPTTASPELKGGSVMDVLGGNSKPKVSSTTQPSLSSLFKKKEGSWECSVCMIQNKAEKSNCAACESAKPTASSESQTSKFHCSGPPVSSSSNTLAAMFKKPPGSWECPTCMIQNAGDKIKCVACETAQPGAAPAPVGQSSAPAPSSSSNLANLFPKPEGAWDCPTCLIQNKVSVDKCVACETSKPSPALQMPTPSDSTPFKDFGDKFKKPEGSWECDTCMVQNKATATKCIACETPKPGFNHTTIATKQN